MARDPYYGSVTSVEVAGMNANTRRVLGVLLQSGAVDNRHRVSVYNSPDLSKSDGAALRSLYNRGLAEKVQSLINEDWGNTHVWWLTDAGVKAARRLCGGALMGWAGHERA